MARVRTNPKKPYLWCDNAVSTRVRTALRFVLGILPGGGLMYFDWARYSCDDDEDEERAGECQQKTNDTATPKIKNVTVSGGSTAFFGHLLEFRARGVLRAARRGTVKAQSSRSLLGDACMLRPRFSLTETRNPARCHIVSEES
eukprot:5550525-Pyramimonas_sp.AAC.2